MKKLIGQKKPQYDGKNLGAAITFIVALFLTVLGAYTLYSLLNELLAGPGPFHGNHHDFLAFYGAALLTLHGLVAQIYSSEALISFQRQIINHPVGAAGYMAYMNPPFAAVLLAPLALLSFAKARLLWLVLNLAVITGIAIWLSRPLDKRFRLMGAFLLVTSFPVYQALIEGQPSILLLLGCVLAYIAAKKQNYVVSGVCLSVLFIKPQFALFTIVGLAIMKQWRVVLAMISSVTALALVLLPITGFNLYFTYAHYMLAVVSDHFSGAGFVVPAAWYGALNTASGVNGFYTALFGQTQVDIVNTLTAASVLILLALFGWAFTKQKFSLSSNNGRLMLAAAIAMALLIDPHLYAQDVVLIYMVLPLLAGFSNYFRSVVLVVITCNVIRLDQKISVHIFTIILYSFASVVFIKTIRKNTAKKSV